MAMAINDYTLYYTKLNYIIPCNTNYTLSFNNIYNVHNTHHLIIYIPFNNVYPTNIHIN